ncbi:hypothetical protein DMB90_08275 [Raoultella planticola]|uniref:Uncharacterized protein n=3 Tax=Raoultella TaxID=160674 RepID=A0A5P6A9H3_RAOPL|nr:hypothetical protein DMB90_08275 [Raoultella planticola]
MNPFTMLFIALLSIDAVRELLGASSVLGMWKDVANKGHVKRDYCRRLCRQTPISSAAISISAIKPPTPFQP